jgi:CHAT domain-containing protein
MTRFYTHLIAGTDIETALQQAKIDLLDRFGEKATPVYWGGFFLSGDGNRRIVFK